MDVDSYEPVEEEYHVEVNDYSAPPLTNEYYQLTILTAHSIKDSLSDAKIDRLLLTARLLFANNVITTTQDIQREKKNWVAPFGIKEKIYCGGKGCEKTLPTMNSNCSCEAPKNEKITVCTSSIIPHILIIVKMFEDELFKERHPTNKRYDLADYMSDQIDLYILMLELILNTDGVMPKQNSRKPFHPVFLVIKNLRGAARSSIKNILVPGIISGAKTPPEWLWEAVLTTLKSDLDHLNVGVPFTRKNGVRVLIKTHFASQMVYKHASHASYGYGCNVCDVFPIREEHGQRWPLKVGELRTANDNRIGLAVVPTAFSQIAPDSLMRLDGLHIIDEGLAKTLTLYLFNQFKILENILTEINRSMIKNGGSILKIKSNAHEMRLLFALSIPILFVTNPDNEKIQISCLFWLLCRIIYSKYLTTTIIDDISPIFEQLGEAMGKILGNSFRTIKAHKFFCHGGAELKTNGTPADYSAAAFECANRLLKLMIDAYNTRGFDRQLLPKHLLQVVTENKIDEMCNLLNLDPEQFQHLYSNPSKNYIYQSVEYTGELLPLMLETDKTFYSVCQNPFTFQFKPANGRYSFFKATLNGVGSCYKAVIGITRKNENYLLAQKLTTVNPITANLFTADLKALADILTKYQTMFFEVKDDENNDYELIPHKNIIAFVIMVEFRNQKFLMDVSERYNKT